MLQYLHVKNLALIEETEVEFSDRLNILTGETGAGKSVLIGSLSYALGGKFSKEMIREGKDHALVELIFTTEDKRILDALDEHDIPLNDGEVIIYRKVTPKRVINKINDVNVTVFCLKEISQMLLDLSGQHENQLLMSPENHLKILDLYGKNEISELKRTVYKLYHEHQEIVKELESMDMDPDRRNREIDFLRYEIAEIDNASLSLGEDEELEIIYRKMSHNKEILSALNEVYEATVNGMPDASSLVGNSIKRLCDVVDYDPDIQGLSQQLSTVDDILNDFGRELSSYIGGLDLDEREFYETEKRLDLINHLKSKYGDSIDKILTYRETNKEKLEKLCDFENHLTELKNAETYKYAELKAASDLLTKARLSVSVPLIREITEALLELNFEKVHFDIEFKSLEKPSAYGNEKIMFMISTNPGMPARPLHETASGGELSRIMLAIKSVLASEENIETLVFDEIDAGISGRTAQKVSNRLAIISRNRQVIAITHLPQIAAMADTHFLIEKSSNEDSTISNIYPLTDEERIDELARMLSGAAITPAVYENAKEIIELANASKNAL